MTSLPVKSKTLAVEKSNDMCMNEDVGFGNITNSFALISSVLREVPA